MSKVTPESTPKTTPEAPPNPAKPTAPVRTTGLSPKQQKLQALREKAARAAAGTKPLPASQSPSTSGFSAKNSFTGKKTAFQRKAT